MQEFCRKRKVRLLTLAGIVTLSAFAIASTGQTNGIKVFSYGSHGPYSVQSVVDGDDIIVSNGVDLLPVHIAYIDGPEKEDPNFKEAVAAVKALTGGKVTFHSSTIDTQGRIIAEVYNAKGENVGLELVRQGAAKVLTEYAPSDINVLQKYSESEAAARNEKVGQWKSQP